MSHHWVVVPAAGVGRRFGGVIPKQYQLLAGKTVMEHSLERLLQLHTTIVVAVHPDDQQWSRLPIFENDRIRTVHGGQERVDSVRLALECLHREADTEDWVLVHDVARPCVAISDIQQLMSSLQAHSVGGLLATPISDTVKRVADEGQHHHVVTTEPRQPLWLAQTPQMFRYGLLHWSLQTASKQGWQVTDEASAVEQLGYQPLVVEGSRDNIKITRREDLVIAEAILAAQATKGGVDSYAVHDEVVLREDE